MSTREKIIVLVAVLALAFAVIHVMRGRGKGGDVNTVNVTESDRLAVYVEKTQEDLESGSMNAAEAEVLDVAARPWEGNPFVERDPSLQQVDETSSVFRYTGFLDMGRLKLAIINDHEYREGDELTSGEYKVESIDALKVILRGKTGGDRVTIPAAVEQGK